MTQAVTPTTAYNLLDDRERKVVDDYMIFVLSEQKRRGERIALAINHPIDPQHSKRSRGILTKPLVRAALAEKINEAANEQDLSPDRVIREHASIAFHNPADFFDYHAFGDMTLKPLNTLKPEQAAAIKSIHTKQTMSGPETKVIFHDKQASLRILTELMGLVAPDNTPVLEDYVRKIEDHAEHISSEKAYQELLESL